MNIPASVGGDSGLEVTLMFVTVILAVFAILAARHFYLKRPDVATSLSSKFGTFQSVLMHKYYIDEIYSALIVRPLVGFSTFLWKIVDVILIDGSINGGAWVYSQMSELLRYAQSGRLRSYATIFVAGVVLLIGYLVMR
jgi:NADH-quinone oxidoreductase subunit L